MKGLIFQHLQLEKSALTLPTLQLLSQHSRMEDDELKKIRSERVAFGKVNREIDSNIYGDEDRGNYSTFVEDDEDDNAEDTTDAFNRSKQMNDRKIRAARDMTNVDGDGELLARDLAERGGSGIVNTRISDRESEVLLLNSESYIRMIRFFFFLMSSVISFEQLCTDWLFFYSSMLISHVTS